MADFDVIIIGAGASGLTCAWKAAQGGRRVALLDHQQKIGRKVALAGGGKGNYTNLTLDQRFYVGDDPSFCAPILRKFGTRQLLDLLDELKIPYEEREFGQIFGLRPAGDFVHALRHKCQQSGVGIFSDCPILEINQRDNFFHVFCHAEEFRAPNLVLATGGPAFPQAGATAAGLSWARQFGHSVRDFRPALVPLLLPQGWLLSGLEGLCLNAKLTVRAPSGQEYSDPLPWRPLLFTHQGLSGPAGLVASCWHEPEAVLRIDFLPEHKIPDLLHDPANGKLLLKNMLSRHLPPRLLAKLLPENLGMRKCAEIGKKERQSLADILHNFQIKVTGDAGFSKAEAARGGVLTSQIKPGLESKIRPGLYFCGELLDITGLLGGYNLHWAIASGQRAALSLSV